MIHVVQVGQQAFFVGFTCLNDLDLEGER